MYLYLRATYKWEVKLMSGQQGISPGTCCNISFCARFLLGFCQNFVYFAHILVTEFLQLFRRVKMGTLFASILVPHLAPANAF